MCSVLTRSLNPLSVFGLFNFLDSVDTDNRPEWEKWREKAREGRPGLVFGSQMPIWTGHGYESLNQLMKQLTGEVPPKKFNSYQENALEHGTFYESRAIEFIRQTELRPGKQITHNRTSFLYECTQDENIAVVCTPDAWIDSVTWAGGMNIIEERSILEIKCPFNNRHKYESADQWKADFKNEHPIGYIGAAIQAALYATVGGCSQFEVAYFFVHPSDTYACLRFKFIMHRILKLQMIDQIAGFSNLLSDKTTSKTIRIPKQRKMDMECRLASALIGVESSFDNYYYDDTTKLFSQKQSSDQTTDD